MSFLGLWTRVCIVMVLAVTSAILAGCSAVGGSAAEQRVTALKIDASLEEPVWDQERGVMLALVEGAPRVARLNPETGAMSVSEPLRGVGENLVPGPEEEGFAFVPQPDLGRVAVIRLDDLQKVNSLEAGSSPARVATDVGSELLFALSEDGSTVTVVDLETFDTLLPPVEKVEAGREAELEGPARGLAAEFWVVGPNGIALYEGQPTSLHKVDDIPISAGAVAGDLIMVTRVYVGEEGTDRLLAVSLNPQTHHLTVAAEKRLGEPIEYIGTDQTRVYAATQSKLVVLKTETFENFGENGFEVVDTIHFRRPLKREALKEAPLSGMAVSPETARVYLTLKGEPYVLSIDKPEY